MIIRSRPLTRLPRAPRDRQPVRLEFWRIGRLLHAVALLALVPLITYFVAAIGLYTKALGG